MAQRDRSDIQKALLAKGFTERDNDHYYYHFRYEGKITPIFTKISKGTAYKTIQRKLLGLMSKQLKLTNQEFLDLVDCTLTMERYIQLLKDRKVLS